MSEKLLEEKLARLDQLQSPCTHCGLCSEVCATFQLTGWEQESPRGRLQLAERLIHGRIPLDSKELSTFDHCLGCRACEKACPHHVSYSSVRYLVQDIRSHLQMQAADSMTEKHYQRWVTLFYRISHVWWRRLAGRWLSIPSTPFQSLGSFMKKQPPVNKSKPVLAVCCVQDLFQHELIQDTLLFFQRLGDPLQVDPYQPCCGALFNRLVHSGEEGVLYPKVKLRAEKLQTQAKKRFLKWKSDQIFCLSRGCQGFISEKGTDMDLYARIEQLLTRRDITLQLPEEINVYYQPYCGHHKRENDSIWRLLCGVEGLKLHEFPQSYSCCGGYCGEGLFHPDRSKKIASKKMEQLPKNVTIVVTSPDCWAAFKSVVMDKEMEILYPIQILSRTDMRLKKNK